MHSLDIYTLYNRYKENGKKGTVNENDEENEQAASHM